MFQDSIFEIQLHDVLAIKRNARGKKETPQKVEIDPGRNGSPLKGESNSRKHRVSKQKAQARK